MRNKIIWNNALHSIRDYVIYLLTVMLSMSLIYAFNLLIFSKELLELSSTMSALTVIITGLTLIVIWVIGWLIHYMAKFVLDRRSKEFGMYMLLGVPDRTIISVFTREHILIGSIALGGALIVGSVLYQILSLIIIQLFHADYNRPMLFSLPAFLLTLFYAMLMYGSSILRLRRYLRKVEIDALLNAEKRNEKTAHHHKRRKTVSFILYLIIGIAGCVVLYICCQTDDRNFSSSILFASLAAIIIGIYGIYATASELITKALLSGNVNKYKGSRLFLFRGLTAKLTTIGKTVGTLALLLTLTLTAAQLGILFENYFRVQSQENRGFDATVSSTNPDYDFSAYTSFMEDKFGIKWAMQYPLYLNEKDGLYKFIDQDTWLEGTPVMAWSDFQKLWAKLGYSELKLEANRYLIIGSDKLKEKIHKTAPPDLKIGETSLKFQTLRTESFNVGNGYHGTGYVAVVADSLAESLPLYHTCYAIQTKKQIEDSDSTEISSLFMDDREFDDQDFIDSQSTNAASDGNKTSMIIVFSFSLFYVGLIFACTAATILAVQQLSDGVTYRYRYRILSSLGMNRHQIAALIFKQVLLYFLVPVCIPAGLSIYISAQINDLVLLSLSTTKVFWGAAAASIGLFLFIYALYFMATYLGYKKRVMEGVK